MLPLLAVLLLAAPQQPLVESIEVRVVDVDVVVTDRAGKPVTGLTKDDFEILEAKKPQAITHFYEVRNGEATAETEIAKSRNFILFVDNRAMHPVLRRYVTAELAKFVDTRFQPGDRATVVMWDRVLNVVTPLTDDKAAIRAGIDKVARTGSPSATKSEFARVQQECSRNLQFALSGRMPIRMAYEECIAYARQETAKITSYSRMVLNAMNVAMTMLAGVNGKKVLVLAGTELPVEPGQDIYQWANGLFTRYMRGFDAAIAQPQDEARTQKELLQTLGRSANAQGVTLYTLSVLMPTDTASVTSGTGIQDQGGDFRRFRNTEAAHETLARLTGGAAVSMSRMDALFDTIAADLGSYYSLGYTPQGDVRGNRDITVRARNRDYTVRARQSYGQKSADEQMTDKVVANVFTPARENEWPIQLRTGTPKPEGKGKYSVPIEITAPPTVTLLPQDNRLVGGFIVYVAAGNAQAALSTTFRQPNGISITAAEEPGFRQTPLVFTATLTVREGESLISAGVVDQISNVAGFARTTVVAK